jgi:hypothetical protein
MTIPAGPLPTIPFRLTRAPDYTPEMHGATDRYEAAVKGSAVARTANEMAEWATELARAKALYGRALLKLDRARRPEAYGERL